MLNSLGRKVATGLLLLGTLPFASCQERLADRPLHYWVTALHSSDAKTQYNAAVALSHAAPQSDEAIDLVLDALEDERLEPVHNVLAEALATVGPRAVRAIPRLARQLHDEHTNVRLAAALALGRVGVAVPASIPALASALQDSDHDVRLAVVSALAAIGPPARSTAPAIALLVNDPIGSVRADALDALDRIDAPPSLVIEALEHELSDWASDIRVKAVEGLARRAPSAPIATAVTKCLRDEAPEVRRAAALALASMGSSGHASIPALLRLRSDSVVTVRSAAESALARIR